jgi:glucose/arabinose dehydrogenase
MAGAAVAGPVDPGHRFERVGRGVADAVALLEMPGASRALVVTRTGDVRLVTGDGLVNELRARVTVSSTCAAHGVLDAAWDPLGRGRVLYVSYTAPTSRALTVGRLDLPTGQVTPVWSHGTAAACSNVGGGLAFASDGTLLVGIGDMGQASRSGNPFGTMGRIYRMTRDGGLPVAPLDPNPLDATSYTYAWGIRSPSRIAADPASGRAWFVDLGPGDLDELNLLAPNAHYGWDINMQMGFLEIPGRTEPFFVWSPTAQPAGLVEYSAGHLRRDLGGDVVFAMGATGVISAVTPDFASSALSTETVLVTRDATGPRAFTALAVLPDGYVYVVDVAGDIYRFRSARDVPREPSSATSIVPMTARKAPGRAIEVAVERVAGAVELGVFRGDVTQLRTAGYTHQLAPPTYFPVDASVSDAYTRFLMTEGQAGGAGSSTYFVVSARRDCLESGVGRGTMGDRPRGPSTCTVDVLGGGSHSIGDVTVEVVATAANGLTLPRDLEFHPDVPNELWVVNRRDHSVVIITNPHEPTQVTSKRVHSTGQHFLAQPSALAFAPGTGLFATSHEEDDYTQGPPPLGTPQDFMGPTLWTSDSTVFEGGDDSHFDMLHDSPNSMGIAWERGNVYWVYDGWHRSLTRYDFVEDHGPSGTDHSDGVVTRYVEGQLTYTPDVVSHVVYDSETGLVLAADTGASRIVALDPSTGVDAGATFPNYDGDVQRAMAGSVLTTLVDGADVGLVAPSGMELWDGLLFVSDNATSRIHAFTPDGSPVDYLDTGFPPGTLMGMAFDPRDGSLYVVDTLTDRVLRIAAR